MECGLAEEMGAPTNTKSHLHIVYLQLLKAVERFVGCQRLWISNKLRETVLHGDH